MKNLKLLPRLTFYLVIIISLFAFIQTAESSETAIVSLPIIEQGEKDSILVVPIKVSTNSNIGWSRFVVEYDSTKISFLSATLDSATNKFQMLLNPNLPFLPTSPLANKNVLMLLYSDSFSTFTGNNQQVVNMTFTIVSSITDTIYLAFDRSKTYLSSTTLYDIMSPDLFFVDSNPLPQPVEVIVNATPKDGGTVIRNPEKVEYKHYEDVILTAIPIEGYRFDHWSGDASGKDSIVTIITDTDKTVTAHFLLVAPKLVLKIEPDVGGSVIRNPDKLKYDPFEEVSLTAIPNDGYRFDHWSGDASGKNSVLKIAMDGNKNITAHFPLIVFRLATSVFPPQSGTIARNPDKTEYLPNEELTLTARPNQGYMFVRWSGNVSGTDSMITLKMDSDKNVTANFVPMAPTLTITIIPSNGGDVTKNPNKIAYDPYEEITLSAVPNDGFRFLYWSGDLSGSETIKTIIMNDHKTVQAYFRHPSTPVADISLSAVARENIVRLNWSCAAELSSFAFEVERSNDGINFISLGTVSIQPNETNARNYCFEDKNVPVGTLYYRIKQVSISGNYHYSEQVEVSVSIPQKIKLQQNYPNPSNPETVIKYQLPDDMRASLRIYDVLGHEIKILVSEYQAAGYYSILWDGTDSAGTPVASGVYLYALATDNSRLIKKMILMR
ncbi:MAG: InlB B-repeat-containing protein [bacterium]|nr:InlB B-repeat-containing protein [bacterium]